MKVRHGFVSNSSSSSFIVAVKKIEKESFRDALHRVFRSSFEIPKDHPLRGFIDPDLVIEAINDSTDDQTDKKTIIEEYLDTQQPFGIDDEKVLDFIKFMSGTEGYVRIGGFSSEEQGLEAALCDNAIKLVVQSNDGEIMGVMFQEGGY